VAGRGRKESAQKVAPATDPPKEEVRVRHEIRRAI
jgi:hypothetical protein